MEGKRDGKGKKRDGNEKKKSGGTIYEHDPQKEVLEEKERRKQFFFPGNKSSFSIKENKRKSYVLPDSPFSFSLFVL